MESEEKRDLKILAVFGLVFFLSSLILVAVGNLYISPDETINAFFTERFAEHNTLYLYEPLNDVLGDVIFPRSTVAQSSRILPGSFLGLPVIFGSVAKVFGVGIIPILTPLIAVGAVFAWYSIVRKIFDRRIALYASLLLFANPGWWYYAARGLMHNVLFASLLIFCAAFLISKPFSLLRGKRLQKLIPGLDVAAAGICFGLALFVRTSELPWMALAAAAGFFMLKKYLSWKSAVIFVLSAAIALSPMFLLNRSLYGSPLATGYTVSDEGDEVLFDGRTGAAITDSDSVSPETVETAIPEPESIFTKASKYLFPFGISPRAVAKHVAWYGLFLFWWLSVLTVIGLPLALPKKKDRQMRRAGRWTYLALFGFIGLWLSLMYGSWTIHDNPDPSAVTIGNSYIRYWLPVFVMTTPFAALAVDMFQRRVLTKFGKKIAVAAIFTLVFSFGIRAVFYSPDDGLVAIHNNLVLYSAIQKDALPRIEPDAVVIVDRSDKIFFPERRVRYPLRDEKTYALMPRIARRAPLYYYGITFPEKDMEYLNGKKLKELGLQIERITTYFEESLYRITEIK